MNMEEKSLLAVLLSLIMLKTANGAVLKGKFGRFFKILHLSGAHLGPYQTSMSYGIVFLLKG